MFSCPQCHQEKLVPRKNFKERRFCSRACAGAYFTGARNPRWRGGKALSYGPGWNALKIEIRARDKVCRHCGKTPEENGRALDVHHVDPYRFFGVNDPDKLLALCRSCHMRADDHGRSGNATYLKMAGKVQRPTKREIARLRALTRAAARRADRDAVQQEAFRLHQERRSLREIAATLEVSHQTVSNWINGVHADADAATQTEDARRRARREEKRRLKDAKAAAQRLRQAGLTTRQIAADVGVSHKTVARWVANLYPGPSTGQDSRSGKRRSRPRRRRLSSLERRSHGSDVPLGGAPRIALHPGGDSSDVQRPREGAVYGCIRDLQGLEGRPREVRAA